MTTSILELPEMRERVARWSVAEYERLTEQGIWHRNAELIRGIVIENMSKSPLHAMLAKRLYDRFLAQSLPGCVVFQEGPLRLADSEPEPDIAVVRGAERDFLQAHPTTAELVIEVAVSSAALDRENASLYAEAGVQEYWIILARQQQAEVYRQPIDGIYRDKRLHEREETLLCAAFPALNIALAELFA